MSIGGEIIILCEGYDDRSFWQGWLLERLACQDARDVSKKDLKHNYQGSYIYRTPGGRLLHVVTCQNMNNIKGKDKVREAARVILKARSNKPLAHLVLNLDVDDKAVSDRQSSVRALIGTEAAETSEGDLVLDGGTLVVSTILWHVPDPVPTGVPAKQILERLACAAICNVFAERGEAVRHWLTSRPEPRGHEHKAYAWSFMAGWHSDHGQGDFYSSLWRDPNIAEELEKLLDANGARRVAMALVG